MSRHTTFYTAYSLLVKDFLRICEFVSPNDLNLATFSHRTYELLVRVCTEFENLSKFVLNEKGSTASGEMNIQDYKRLEQLFVLSRQEVGLLFWTPSKKYIAPFADWGQQGRPLGWYQDYNKVKHNRESEFSKASLENLVLSLSGLFLCLHAQFGEPFFSPYSPNAATGVHFSAGVREIFVDNSIFSIRKPST